MPKIKSCPDCNMPLESNGCCSECGYGEESVDEEDEKVETQSLLDVRDALQNALKLIDRMIVNNADCSNEHEDMSAPVNTVTWVRQGSRNA